MAKLAGSDEGQVGGGMAGPMRWRQKLDSRDHPSVGADAGERLDFELRTLADRGDDDSAVAELLHRDAGVLVDDEILTVDPHGMDGDGVRFGLGTLLLGHLGVLLRVRVLGLFYGLYL